MIVLRSLLFNALFYISLFIVGTIGIPALVNREATRAVARVWARVSIWLMEHVAGIRLEVRGREHLPPGGCLIASKHQSAMETFALVALVDGYAFVLKRELTWLPVFGWYAMRSGMIAVNRGARSSALRALVVDAEAAMARGRQIIIFPEGTRRPPGAPPEYKFGVVQLYTRLDTVCVPVALNSGLFWPRRSFLRYPGTTVIEFLPPIERGLDSHAFRARMQSEIEAGSDRLIAEARARGEGIPADRIKPPQPPKPPVVG